MSAKGGITKGKSHAEGGIPMVVKSTGQKVELEGGEGVINKRNMASTKTYEFEGEEKTICEIASDINSADGNGVEIDCDGITGRKYKHKEGGRITSDRGDKYADGGDVKHPFAPDLTKSHREKIISAYLGNKMSRGGMVDLFEEYEQQPPKVRAIYDKYQDKIIDGDFDYSDSADFLKEMESIGYTFEYGLDNEPYGLRPIDVPLNQLEGYEDYAKGGEIKDIDYTWRETPSLVKIKKIKKTAKGGYSALFHYVDEGREKWERLDKGTGYNLWKKDISYARGGGVQGSTFSDTTYMGGKKVHLRYIFDDSMKDWQDEAQAHIDWFSKQGKIAGVVHKGNQHALYVEKVSNFKGGGLASILWEMHEENERREKAKNKDIALSELKELGVSDEDIARVSSKMAKGGDVKVGLSDKVVKSVNVRPTYVSVRFTDKSKLMIFGEGVGNVSATLFNEEEEDDNYFLDDGTFYAEGGEIYDEDLFDIDPKEIDKELGEYGEKFYDNLVKIAENDLIEVYTNYDGYDEEEQNLFVLYKPTNKGVWLNSPILLQSEYDRGNLNIVHKFGNDIVNDSYAKGGDVKVGDKVKYNGYDYFVEGMLDVDTYILSNPKKYGHNKEYVKIQEIEKYAKGGGIDNRIIRSQDEAHLMSILIGLGMRAKSPYRPNQSYFDKTDRKKLNEIYDRLNKSTYAEGGKIEDLEDELANAKYELANQKRYDKNQDSPFIKSLERKIKELEEEIKYHYEDEEKANKKDFYETWDRFKDDIRTRFGHISKDKFEDGGEVNMYLKDVFDEYEVFKEGGSVPMINLKNSLGYDKSELPQLRGSGKPLFQKYLENKYGRNMVKTGQIKASELNPTQNKINPAQIDIIASVGMNMDEKPISISSDWYVIDGHHRWFHQKMKNKDIKYVQYDLPAEQLIEEMLNSGLAEVDTIESVRTIIKN